MRDLVIHEWERSGPKSQETTGMRLWKRTREGIKRERVGVVDTNWVGGIKVSRGGEGPGEWLFLAEVIGLDLSDVFRRRTGPGPDEDRGSEKESEMRERSAMSHGLRSSGAASRVAIHGRSSNAWDVGRSKRGARRRRRDCAAALERVLEAIGVYACDASVRKAERGEQTRLTGGGGVKHESERWIGELRRSRGWGADEHDAGGGAGRGLTMLAGD